ncbi:MAG: allophanate hydrolase subunit 1 [Microbacterium sp.]|nr:allophanate hydrolase subunit 1 [Microbacterium sp.]
MTDSATVGRARILPMGDAAVLIEHPDPLALYRAARASIDAGTGPVQIVDLVPAERTLLVRFEPEPGVAGRIGGWIGMLRIAPTATVRPAGVVIDVQYDGADLENTAALLGLSSGELVSWHSGADWSCAFVGFAPGFGYLVPDAGPRGQSLDVPRLDVPRTRVPAGSVALAGAYGGIYPRESPGGWRLIGTTDAMLWDDSRSSPALLEPGTRVRFRDVGAGPRR